jgi:hypothetical protein
MAKGAMSRRYIGTSLNIHTPRFTVVSKVFSVATYAKDKPKTINKTSAAIGSILP